MALILYILFLFDFINKNSVFFNSHVFVFCFDTENRGFSLVSVPNTEMLLPWQHHKPQITAS